MAEDDVRDVLAFEDAMIGSDGIPHDERPHPRLWGTFPRVLGHYSRDIGLMPLEEAVRRMTGVPADVFGLKDRGYLREGAFADLVIFDPETVIDRANFDTPMEPAGGVDAVMTNGAFVWQSGAATGAKPGRALRRGRRFGTERLTQHALLHPHSGARCYVACHAAGERDEAEQQRKDVNRTIDLRTGQQAVVKTRAARLEQDLNRLREELRKASNAHARPHT